MLTLLARRYDSGAPVRAQFADGRLTAIEPLWTREPLADWPWLAPAFLDVQINGYGGHWFSDERLTVEQALDVLDGYRRRGLSQLCPTLITNSQPALEHGVRTLRAACEKEAWADRMVAGLHLEGPYISPVDGPRGAHPAAHVRACDWSEFAGLNAASGQRMRLVTLAPEAQGAEEFIRRARAAQITVALGHTDADSAQFDRAVAAGAQLSTHLGNGCRPVLPRHPNPLWDQLSRPELWASVISDGHHLSGSILRSILSVKGVQRTLITCDASGLAGCPPASYDTPFGPFDVLHDGRVVISGQQVLLAGSALTTEDCVSRMLSLARVSLRHACDMAGRVPRALLGLEPVRLMPGEPANHVLFRHAPPDGELRIERVITSVS